MKKGLSLFIAMMMIFAFAAPATYAIGAKEAGASLLLPTTGQAMNGEISARKTKVMAGVEVAALTTVAVLGTAVGGGVVWAGLGPLIANHLWSATDAYKGAQKQYDPAYQQQVVDAQRTLEFSRQNRFEREQSTRAGIRERIQRAGELAYQS